MTYNHFFTVYCKGKQEDIDGFKERIENKMLKSGRADDEYDTEDSPVSISFARRQTVTTHEAWADFLPVMKEFTEDTGKPLSFFYALDFIESDEDEKLCGYAVFDGGKLVDEKSTDWCTPQEFKSRKKDESDAYGEKLDKQFAHLEAEFKRLVQPDLDEWLKAKPAKPGKKAAPKTPEAKGKKPAAKEQAAKPAPAKTADIRKDPKYKEYLKAVKNSHEALYTVPAEYITRELLLYTVKGIKNSSGSDKQLFAELKAKIDKKHFTPEFILEAVEIYSEALRLAPEELLTAEFLLAIMNTLGYHVLDYIPKHVLTEEICVSIVNIPGKGHKALPMVPEKLRTPAVYLAAVQNDGEALGLMPEALRTAEVCLAAVQQYGEALGSVPEALRTAEVCLAAVQRYGYAIQYVPEALRTPELCLAAVQQHYSALYHVPKALWKDAEFCIAAVVQQDAHALKYVPKALQAQVKKTVEMLWEDAAFCRAAVQKNGRALEYVSEALRTAELCRAAVQQNGWALEDVPEALRTAELCLAAVQEKARALSYVPEALKAQVEKAAGI
jgi:tetratricopeptide (TPR) repeat protein